jgi:hypothetical protein
MPFEVRVYVGMDFSNIRGHPLRNDGLSIYASSEQSFTVE